MYIQRGMSIKCRTEEEITVFNEVATAEGHLWADGNSLIKNRYGHAPMSFQVGCFTLNKYPKDISYSENVDFKRENMTPIEAADLFRNILISRRIKNGTNSTIYGS